MRRFAEMNVSLPSRSRFWKVLELQLFASTRLQETLFLFLLAGAGFLVPFLLGHNQLLVGSVVNAMLFSSAFFLRGRKILPLVLMPSLGAVAGGLLFGNLTVFLIYMVPFIWLGNLSLVFLVKLLNLRMKMNYWLGAVIASSAKALLLFSCAFALYSFGLVPALFLTAMGIMQLCTALAGSALAFPLKHVGKFFG